MDTTIENFIPSNFSAVRPVRNQDDLFFDYLLDLGKITSQEEIELLQAEGYDLNLTHYTKIICSYLPFVHFGHLTEKWQI